jgi:bile acid-coenzyme A ligase
LEGFMEILLGDVPSHQAQRLGPDRWAIRHGEDVLTWSQLDDRATRRAHALADKGVGQDDRVVLALPNGNALFELSFALWKLGATPTVVSARMPAGELSEILALAEPREVIVAPSLMSGIGNALPSDFGADHHEHAAIQSRVARNWKILTSGGSTGRPKLIVANQPSRMNPDAALLRQPKDSVIINPGPCHHNMPFATSVLAMVRGCCITGMVRFDPLEFLRLVECDRPEWVTMVPTMMSRIWALPPERRGAFDVSSLNTVVHTAAPIAAWLKRAWIDWLGPERIVEVYGGTEGVGITAITGSEWLERPGSVGRPVGCSIQIVDPDGTVLGHNRTGEIYFTPLHASADETFAYVGAQMRKGPLGSVSLGDNGWLDDDGFLYVIGRRTDLILRGGENVYPAEIEAALSECEGVAACVVIGLPHEDLGESVHAIIEVQDPARPPSADDLQAHVAARLDRHKCPASYEFVSQPLRDAAGKVRRSTLREERTSSDRTQTGG